MDKPLDVAQLSTCCGKPLAWERIPMAGEPDGYTGRCPCGMEWTELSEPTRDLLPTEKLLLARIAERESALSWQVTAAGMLVEDNSGLRARIAELEATLANERGEGDPPVPGWRYDENSGRWWIGDVVVGRPLPPAVGWRWGDRQGWDWRKAGTARDAMRAASAVSPGADAPKGE